jgi:hypothetical protein
MKPQPEHEADPPLLTPEQQGEEWNRAFGIYDNDDDDECLPSGKLPPNCGLIDHLQACPYPFEIPPRQKDFTRAIDFGDASE